MIQEQRIYAMSKLAIFEKNHRDQLNGVRVYFRSDYIGRHMIKNGFRITLAFLLVLAGWGLYHSETLIVDITKIDVQALAARIVFAYATVLSVFLVMTYAIYSVRYERARQDLHQYQEMLKKVSFLYETEDHLRRREELERKSEVIERRVRRARRESDRRG